MEILIKAKYNLHKSLPGLPGYSGLVWLLENTLSVVVVAGVVVGLVEGIFLVIGSYPVGLGGALAGSGHTMPGLSWTQLLESTSNTRAPVQVCRIDFLCSHWKYWLQSVGCLKKLPSSNWHGSHAFTLKRTKNHYV